jgi:hypothetical protein
MGASEWMIGRGKPPNAPRAKGVEKEEKEEKRIRQWLLMCLH